MKFAAVTLRSMVIWTHPLPHLRTRPIFPVIGPTFIFTSRPGQEVIAAEESSLPVPRKRIRFFFAGGDSAAAGGGCSVAAACSATPSANISSSFALREQSPPCLVAASRVTWTHPFIIRATVPTLPRATPANTRTRRSIQDDVGTEVRSTGEFAGGGAVEFMGASACVGAETEGRERTLCGAVGVGAGTGGGAGGAALEAGLASPSAVSLRSALRVEGMSEGGVVAGADRGAGTSAERGRYSFDGRFWGGRVTRVGVEFVVVGAEIGAETACCGSDGGCVRGRG
mmetsp:Transcript_1169/g.2340  ORF Transcript_1169/g.2340 Transcript_1169/m.2340 type:complete len:284 (-) Transcript_1169:109-960(-)